jgi:hypothetical protein
MASSVRIDSSFHSHATRSFHVSFPSQRGDIHAGTIKPAATLKRANKGEMSFYCTFPQEMEGLSLLESNTWVGRTVVARINARDNSTSGTFAELRKALQVRSLMLLPWGKGWGKIEGEKKKNVTQQRSNLCASRCGHGRCRCCHRAFSCISRCCGS